MNSTNAKFAIVHLLRCALFRAIFLWQSFLRGLLILTSMVRLVGRIFSFV